MGPWKATPEALDRVKRYNAALAHAKTIDPEAFKPIMMPTFTKDQERRQDDALTKALKDMDHDR